MQSGYPVINEENYYDPKNSSLQVLLDLHPFPLARSPMNADRQTVEVHNKVGINQEGSL